MHLISVSCRGLCHRGCCSFIGDAALANPFGQHSSDSSWPKVIHHQCIGGPAPTTGLWAKFADLLPEPGPDDWEGRVDATVRPAGTWDRLALAPRPRRGARATLERRCGSAVRKTVVCTPFLHQACAGRRPRPLGHSRLGSSPIYCSASSTNSCKDIMSRRTVT